MPHGASVFFTSTIRTGTSLASPNCWRHGREMLTAPETCRGTSLSRPEALVAHTFHIKDDRRVGCQGGSAEGVELCHETYLGKVGIRAILQNGEGLARCALQ